MFQSIFEHIPSLQENRTLILSIAERAGYFLAGALVVGMIWKYTSHIKERSRNFDEYASKLESVLKKKNSENAQTLANTVLYTQHLAQRINAKWNRSICIMFIKVMCLGTLVWGMMEISIPSCVIGSVYMVMALLALFTTESICELHTLRMEKKRLQRIFEQPVIDDQISEIVYSRKYSNN